MVFPPPHDMDARDVQEVAVEPYRIVRRLAQGGMGVVYEAEHPVLRRRVALKVLRPQVAALPDALARFRREAQVLARLEHPHAVRVYDFVETGRQPFLVMEYVEGESLASRLAASGPLGFDDVCTVARQVLDVLEVAHAQGVVHRDLKPANLLLDAARGPGLYVRVVDFGVALLQEPTQARLTADGVVTGTAEYMSPEQVAAASLDGRSDLYALACVLFELLTGRPPFIAAAPATVLSAHLFREPPRLEELGVLNVPPAWQAALRRALSKPRDARFATAGAMRAALEEAAVAGARGGDERAVLSAGPDFVAAQADDPPVALLAAPDADPLAREALENALAGAGVTVVRTQRDAGVVVLLAKSGAAALAEVARVRAASDVPVLLCGGDDELDVMTKSIEAGVYDYIPLPLEGADAARKVVRALKARRPR